MTEDSDFELEETRHKHKMLELQYERDSNERIHNQNLEAHRITNAETVKRDIAHLERQKELALFRKEHWAGAKR